MKLYYSPGACSLSPHIVAEEAGLKLDYVKVSLKDHKTEDGGDYYAVNPKGYVPALKLDDGSVLAEGPAIVQYLADRNPDSGLAPKAGTFPRYKLQEWLTFIGTELHKNFSPLFGGGSEEAKNAAKEKIKQRFAYVNGELAGKDYLLGSQFSAADAYLFVMTLWSRFNSIELPPNLQAFAARVAARPAVQAALKAEGLG